MSVNKPKSIEDVLFERKLLTTDQLSAIKFEHVNSDKPTTEIIKERGYVSSEDYAKAFGEAYGFEFIDLTGFKINPKLFENVPLSLTQKFKVIPVALDGNILKLAMGNPLDLQTIDFVERKSGYKIVPLIALENQISHFLDEQHGKAIADEISAALQEISDEKNVLKIEESHQELTEATIRDAPIARVVGMILETAVKLGASDIHLEPGESDSRLRYRVDGVLEEKRRIPKEMHDSIIARIKILSGSMKIDEKRIPQDGRIKFQVGKVSVDLRVSTLPTIFGEKVVIRLLREEGVVFSFKDLGLRGLSLRRFEESLLKPTGMVLVTGPTGSGKSVTQASALSKLNSVRVNIVTIEDPVEIRVPGVNQVQVNPQAGLTFATGLRAFLRQDPNVIMIGEIRDAETAELAVHAALTGHLVLATLHTNSSSGAIPRLLDMGVESFLLASTINSVLAQRLVRRICPDCKEAYDAPSEIAEDITASLKPLKDNKVLMTQDHEVAKLIDLLSKEKLSLYKGKGCDKCGNTGYKGRVGIFEVLRVSTEVAHMTLENSPASKIESVAKDEGMVTLQQDGFLRVIEGVTTLEEVMRVSSS